MKSKKVDIEIAAGYEEIYFKRYKDRERERERERERIFSNPEIGKGIIFLKKQIHVIETLSLILSVSLIAERPKSHI